MRRRALLGAGVAALAIVGGAVPGGILPVAQAASPGPSVTASSAAAGSPVALAVDELEPRVVRPGDTVVIRGTLSNETGDAVGPLSVVLRVSPQRIATRYDLALDSDPSTVLGYTLAATRQRFDVLEPGETEPWQISVPVALLDLPNSPDLFGAYPVAIEARSTVGGQTVTARVPTTLLWMPDHAHLVPTQVSWLVPLEDGVHRGMGATFLDDQLAADLAAGGRLGTLLTTTAAANIPLTYAVDPALVDDATVMAGPAAATVTPTPAAGTSTSATGSAAPPAQGGAGRGGAAGKSATATPSASPTPSPYQVAGTGTGSGGTVGGTGAGVAATWLEQLHHALQQPGTQVLGLPYADADLTALEHAGLDREIAIARAIGQSTLAADLGVPATYDTVWPVNSTLDTTTLEDLAGDFVDAVVLSDTSLPPRDPDAVPGIRTDLQTASGRVRAVLSDSAIDSLVANPLAVADNPRLTEQRILAETMLITEQRPGTGSSIVLTLPRRVDVSDGFVRQLLTDTSLPWLQPVDLQAVVDEPADGVERAPLAYPDADRAAELSPGVLAPAGALRETLSRFNSVLGSGVSEPAINAASVAIVRAESSSLRTDTARAARIVAEVRSTIGALTGKVYIADPRLITLTSRKQRIPITVVNELPTPVTVEIRLAAVNPTRLKVAPIAPFTVPKNSRQDVLVDVEARTNGRFPVVAQLMTPETDPRPYGAPITFEIHATAFGAVALAIAGGAAGLLFLVAAVRLIRRAVRSRRQPPESGPGARAAQPEGVPDGVDVTSP